jgi:hypothetical protein
VLEQAELRRWAAAFGVAAAQIRKDHLISHLLAGLSQSSIAESAVFFGGTALARTHLTDGRVSEDIDLWAESSQRVFALLVDEMPRLVRREYPGLTIDADMAASGNAVARDGTSVRLQVVGYGAEYRRCIRVERRAIALRYGDLPDQAELLVPDRSSLVALKHMAWAERMAPRDLVDLNGLASIGAIDIDAESVVECLRGSGVRPAEYGRIGDGARRAWEADLAHQMTDPPDPDTALARVRQAWAGALRWQ